MSGSATLATAICRPASHHFFSCDNADLKHKHLGYLLNVDGGRHAEPGSVTAESPGPTGPRPESGANWRDGGEPWSFATARGGGTLAPQARGCALRRSPSPAAPTRTTPSRSSVPGSGISIPSRRSPWPAAALIGS